MHYKSVRGFQGIIFMLILISVISCVPFNKLKYFNDIDQLPEPAVNREKQKLIMPFDNIYIKVYSIDEKTNLLFNSNSNGSTGTTSSIIGNLVDEEGNIDYPFIGKINISGLTLDQAGIKLGKALSEYVSNAAIIVKFIDRNVTIMGAVQQQGVFPFNQDKLNIYEALALGGGISQFGNRKNVILIRQEGDKIMHHRLDLSDSKISGKDYYYIQANDVIVVEPLSSSAWYNFNNSTFSIILSSITSFLTIILLFRTL
ncbi:MAG: polysaccharide biosynthesis/export family protein [Bacteroidota bacterium]